MWSVILNSTTQCAVWTVQFCLSVRLLHPCLCAHNQNFSINRYFCFCFRWITCIEYLSTYFSVKSTVCLMLGLMIGNSVLFVHCKLLLHKELVLSYQVAWRETKIQWKRKRTYPNLSVSISNFFVSVFVSGKGIKIFPVNGYFRFR